MFYLVILSIIAGAVYALVLPPSISTIPEGRIVGGEPVDISNVPHQVSILFQGSHLCGGTLVGLKQYVITAAQCTNGKSTLELTVRGASTYTTDGTIKEVQTVHQHPKYSDWTFDYDIAVLKLTSAFDLDDGNVTDAELPTLDPVVEVPNGHDLMATGWGAVLENGQWSEELRVVTLKSLDVAVCVEAFGKGMITENMRCAGADDKDTCDGDTGGPLVINETLLIGITSWGFGCARPGYPSIFTDVIGFRQYIGDIIGM